MLNLFVAFAILIIQLIIISLFYSYHRTLTHPTLFIQIYITAHIMFAVLAFREYNFSFYGILWVLLAMFLFSLGGLLATGFIKSKPLVMKNRCNVKLNAQFAKGVLIISIILGLLYSIEFLLIRGLSIKSLFNLEALMDLNHEVAVARYTGNSVGVSKISRILLVFIYFSPLIAGFNFNFFKTKKLRLLCIMGVLPAIFVIMTNNTKATLVSAIFLFISGYITSSIKSNDGLPKISFKNIILIFSGIFTFLSVLYGSMIMRVGKFDINLIKVINDKFMLYALGHIPGFDIWFTNNATSINYHFGTRTFYGIADFLGVSQRVQGVYIDRAYWSTWSTNVFTFFRSFIEDFGPYLGLAIMFFLGFFMSLVFYRAKFSKSISKGAVLLTAFYYYILFIFTSVWSYMSYTLAFILFAIYVHFLKNRSNYIWLDKGVKLSEKNRI